MLREQLAKFNSIMQGIEKFYADYAKSVGLTYMSLTVLEIIYYAPNPITQKEICEESHYIKQMVNNIVKKERKGKETYYSLDDDHVKEVIETMYEHALHHE